MDNYFRHNGLNQTVLKLNFTCSFSFMGVPTRKCQKEYVGQMIFASDSVTLMQHFPNYDLWIHVHEPGLTQGMMRMGWSAQGECSALHSSFLLVYPSDTQMPREEVVWEETEFQSWSCCLPAV